MFSTSGGNLFQIFRVWVTGLFLLGNGDRDVSGVFNNVTEFLLAGLENRDADGGRAHVHTSARLAEVKGYADHTNFVRGNAGIG